MINWREMTDQEKEAYLWSVLDVTPDQLDQVIQEFTRENGKKPNSIFISWTTLAKIPVKIKKIQRPAAMLRVIPMEADPGQFVISLQDPHNWGDIFYS